MLAERAYIAQQAQGVEIRRSGGPVSLLDAATAAVDGADLSWDAFRREDGRWVVTARFHDAAGDHQATWTYDHSGRNLHPQDDDARALMGARRPAADLDEADIADALNLASPIAVVREPVTDSAPRASKPTRPHLVAVPDAEPIDAEPTDAADDSPASEPGDAAARDGGAPADDAPTRTTPAGQDQQTVAIVTGPQPKAARAKSTSTRARRSPAGKAVLDKPVLDKPGPDDPAPAAADSAADSAADAAPPKPAPVRKPRARKPRASVPTWDEILFGAAKATDDGD